MTMPGCGLLFFVATAAPYLIAGKVVGTFVVPHGGLALDPSHANLPNATSRDLASKIHRSLMETSKTVGTLEPDIIFLSTPHGLADMERFLFYLNGQADGVTYADNCTTEECKYNLSIPLAADESMALMESLRKSHKVSGISGFGPPGHDQEMPLPLAWGEIIPLYYIPRLNSARFIVFSHPFRRYNHTKEMIPELLHLGRSLYLHLQRMKQKIVVVISADLAHTHLTNGPYGFSPAAQPFDDAVGVWLQTLDATALLETAGNLVGEALSCGFPGLVILHGMLSEGGLKQWISRMLINGHPTYYGMAVASLIPSRVWSNI